MLKKIISKFQEDKSALAEFKEKILKEKTKIEEELENLKNPEMDEFVHLPSFGDGDDLSDEADQLEDMGNALAVRQVLEKKLEAINESLDRIKKGKYGICDRCGGEIEIKRLKIEPVAKICGKCVKEVSGK